MDNSHVTLPLRKLIYTLCIRRVEHTRFNLRRNAVLENVNWSLSCHIETPWVSQKAKHSNNHNSPGAPEFYIGFNYTNANADESVRLSS